ncbi:hypothetical protein CYMTET_17247 [Cymbomonas tetramitiformis]|uniref:IPT/TIG domain-containing protein n=1 Tax=Cymbomonas tetramitiformis TaxID=36881 RepID=A0AAE0L7G7_9CHLO|nr:hypothetical protein CYMTET_17247 [Cymbomonas tetramitiformis]
MRTNGVVAIGVAIFIISVLGSHGVLASGTEGSDNAILREINSVFPKEGSTAGGTLLSISGAGFSTIATSGGNSILLVDPSGIEEPIACEPVDGACTVDCPTSVKAMCETPAHEHSDTYYEIHVTVDSQYQAEVRSGESRPTFRWRSSATSSISQLQPTSGEGGVLKLKGSNLGNQIASFKRVWIGRGGYKSGSGANSAGTCSAGEAGPGVGVSASPSAGVGAGGKTEGVSGEGGATGVDGPAGGWWKGCGGRGFSVGGGGEGAGRRVGEVVCSGAGVLGGALASR